MSDVSTTGTPLVSVLTTAYNREAYIGGAIESVLNGHYGNFELIVVDDCSTDGTADVARRYAHRDPRVKVHVNETNLGDYPNRNRAASLANGKYLKYLDSDDMLYPHGLTVMVDCMERFPDAGFGLSQTAEAMRPHPILLTSAEAYRENFFGRDLFGRAPGSSIIRRDAFEAVGGFSGNRFIGDQELWLGLGRRFPLVTIPRDLYWSRTHGEQERAYEGDRAILARRDLQRGALQHPDCPLTVEEQVQALRLLNREQAKAFWRYFLLQRSPRAALQYRRLLDISWPSLLSFPFARERAGGAMPSRR